MTTQVEISSDPRSRFAFAIDVLLVVSAMVLVKQLLLPITIVFAGPISLLVAVVLASWRLWARGISWSSLGLIRPTRIWPTILLGFLTFVGIIAAVAISAPIATEILLVSRVEDAGESRFGGLEGNLPKLLLWLCLSWVHAGFNEELVYRAFLISHLERVFNASRNYAPTIGAILLAACFFGYRHMYYQGWYGFVTTGAVGLFLGVVYAWVGRKNIWILVIGHGLLDSLGMTLRFLGLDD